MISIIILTYNSEKYIEKLLDSIVASYKKDIEKEDIEILVADNASSDNTVKIAKKFGSLVSVTDNGGNVGFAKGNNIAAKKAKGDYILFLNPDAEFNEGDIKKLVQNLNKESIGVVGGRITSFNGTKELSCGKFYTFLNIFIMCLGLEEKLGVRFAPPSSQVVDYVSGGFMALKKDTFLENGGFDEHYFMYVEDQDLCFRLKKKGLYAFFTTDASIKHIGQGSSNRSFAIIHIYKGLSYFQKKHMGFLSYNLSMCALKTKAYSLFLLGKLTRNAYLSSTYEKAFQSI